EVHERRIERMLILLLQRIEVAYRRAALHAPFRLGRRRRMQQRLDQTRLARRAVTDQRNRANRIHGVVRHDGISSGRELCPYSTRVGRGWGGPWPCACAGRRAIA